MPWMNTRSRLYVAMLLAALAASVPLGAVEVRGDVRDIYNAPLAGILIRVGSDGRIFSTDENGEFRFEVDEREATLCLHFESPYHYKDKKTVSLRKLPDRLTVVLIPIRLLKEEVSVTALNREEKAVSVPFAQSIVSSVSMAENQPETVVQALQQTPGVHFIGKGGVSVTPSVRGLARRRILLLAGGARITSDRSAGASAQFFPPEFVERIEVVRSAASVLYGSDAIGGVIQIIPRSTRNSELFPFSLNASGHALDGKFNGGLAFRRSAGPFSVLASVQYTRAGDYRSGGGTILNSGYRYLAADLAASYETPERSFTLNYLRSAGRDIGKPERANDPSVSSVYPSENTNLLTFHYCENAWIADGTLSVSLFLNPNDYELNKIKSASRQLEISSNSALDFGLRAALKKAVAPHWLFQFGIDYSGRSRVDMENETWKDGTLAGRSLPVADGQRGDLGIYFTIDYSGWKPFDVVAGGRLGHFTRSARTDGQWRKKSSLAPAFFLGLTRRIQDTLTLFLNVGTAYRLPSLSEAFYTGITGRSSIVGNPDLKPETSVNLDAGIRVHGARLFCGAYLFQYDIRDMIEKFPLGENAYTYENIERGRIRGLEAEFQFRPLEKIELFGSGLWYRGRSTAGGGALNDVPSAKLFLGAKSWLGRFWGEVTWMAQAAVTRPGPAEAVIPAVFLTDLKAGCYFSNHLFLFLKVANLFDRAYYANADPDIPQARGRDLSLGLSLNF
ncbi:MAG: TonB-dependent receptor [Candidatus Aminicenantes bacterium]|nr:TonB-dependent receptor [Candidatus Aminicenantes bacterium]